MSGFEVGDIIELNHDNVSFINSIWKIIEIFPNETSNIKCVKSNHIYRLNEVLTFCNIIIEENFIKFKAKKSEDILSEWI